MVGTVQADRLSPREKAVWNQVKPSVVTLFENDRPCGVAALIDDSGYFVAHSSGVSSAVPAGKSFGGKEVSFSVVSRDPLTQLVLLKATDWVSGTAKPFRIPNEEETDGGVILAVLPTGPIRAAYVSKHQPGVLKPSRRLVTLTEIRFEAPTQAVGGALILSESGELIGTLNATLDRPEGLTQNQTMNQNSLGQNQTARGPSIRIQNQILNAGPGEMTVAYAVGPEVVQHTLQGFLSSKHEAEYAMLGIFCTNAIGGGAYIQSVSPNSPAQKAGLRPGDILLSIGYNQIADQVAFATVMLQQKVGKKITLMIKRGRGSLLIDAVPSKSTE
ncbi:MAG: PDZ domain-containing protein [Fimbriimonas sp.]|nr:PDZ domain-containing protein [Fimbriimonas sp.]